jgi:hypothetical protein
MSCAGHQHQPIGIVLIEIVDAIEIESESEIEIATLADIMMSSKILSQPSDSL